VFLRRTAGTLSGGEREWSRWLPLLCAGRNSFSSTNLPAVSLSIASAQIAELVKNLKDKTHLSMLVIEQNLKIMFDIVDKCYLWSAGE
jgi:ABC-type branched-subunit amino acid transport system ATPase component